MATIVVGGSGRNVGKTTLVCGLVAALPEFRWTAVKTTSHAHGHAGPVWEETAAGQGSDTARFLAAGARRALLVCANGEDFPIAAMRTALGRDTQLIFESNRILDHLEPDVCLAVVGGDEAEVKPVFAGFIRRADGIVVRAAGHAGMVDVPATARIFELADFAKISPEMMDWLKSRLGAADGI